MQKEEFKEKMYQIFEEAGVEAKEKYEIEASSLQYITIITCIEDEFEIELPDEFLAYNGLQNPEEFIDRVYTLKYKK